jgi:hypothetical protein
MRRERTRAGRKIQLHDFLLVAGKEPAAGKMPRPHRVRKPPAPHRRNILTAPIQLRSTDGKYAAQRRMSLGPSCRCASYSWHAKGLRRPDCAYLRPNYHANTISWPAPGFASSNPICPGTQSVSRGPPKSPPVRSPPVTKGLVRSAEPEAGDREGPHRGAQRQGVPKGQRLRPRLHRHHPEGPVKVIMTGHDASSSYQRHRARVDVPSI